MEKNQEFFYTYGKHLIEKTKELTIKEMDKPSNSLYVKDGIINKSGDVQVGFDDFLNRSVLDFVNKWKDDFPVILVSEETGVEVIGKNPKHFMIIDPLDGSNNIRPWFTPEPIISVSLAIGALENLQCYGNHKAIDFSMQKKIFNDTWYYSTDKGAYFERCKGRGKLKPSLFRRIEKKLYYRY